MTLTVVVTRNVPDRYRGFLASVMLEVSPGTYLSPGMTRGVRERVWSVCCDWSSTLPQDGSVTMIWGERSAPSGLGLLVLGAPKIELTDHNGLWLAARPLTSADERLMAAAKLTTLSDN